MRDLRVLLIAVVALASSAAKAQRAAENAATAADDGFGKSVGSESVGIYASGEVRGFSANDAGNARIEGLYFDESGGISNLFVAESDIKVGLTAFGQPFPAPTGIVDATLRRPNGDRPIVTARINAGDYFGVDATLEAGIPLTSNLGIYPAVGYFDDRYPDGVNAWFVSYGNVLRWQPAPRSELTVFFSRYDYGDEETGPLIYTAGPYLPKEIKRRRYFGQDWALRSGHSQNFGGLAKTTRGGWKVEAGLFRSSFTQDDFASAWFARVDRDGIGQRFIQSGRDQSYVSWSGEARVSRDWRDGPRRHRLIASVRGRTVDARYGGFDLAAIGPGEIGVPDPVPEPVRVYGVLTDDRVRQTMASVGYDLVWQDRGELNLGVTRSDYRKAIDSPDLPSFSRRDRNWLWNGALALKLNGSLTLYTATTRGLEETGSAPLNAVNANEVLPALRTRQFEAGLRLALSRSIRFVASWFDLRKPYFEIDRSDGFFKILGEVQHQGYELSLSGKPVSGLSFVAGAVFMDAQVTGEAVADGRLGRRPIGRTRTLIDASVDWMPAGQKRWSVDLRLLFEGRREADALNRFSIPQRLTADLAARYRFKIGTSPAILRVKLANLTDVFGWRVSGGGGFRTNAPRRLTGSIIADF
nr:TonB-dependent receptor [Novosphingobium piscinae]